MQNSKMFTKFLLMFTLICAIMSGTKANNCCKLGNFNGDLSACSQYLASIGCRTPLCASCYDSNIVFSMDPSCNYPC